ncbi:MAG: transcriptional regulator [Alcanivorax sp.]|nr:MAG: transcriptional regulator [Alcanivorax sp.]
MGSNTWDNQRQQFQSLIKELRKSAGLTQIELAQKLDRPQSYVSKYESGERRLDVIELREVCNACGVTLEEFSRQIDNTINGTRKI